MNEWVDGNFPLRTHWTVLVMYFSYIRAKNINDIFYFCLSYRLDKGLKYLASGGQTGLGGFSEDESGKFQTIGYGNELADMMGDESWKHGFINKAFSGEATGTGGGAGDARARTVIINVDHINNDMDLKHVGDYFSEKLQEDNKKTAGT